MEAALATRTLVELEAWLNEALAARHQILIGKKATYIAHDGSARSYKVDNLKELDQYISSLKAAINAKLTGDFGSRAPIHIGIGFGS